MSKILDECVAKEWVKLSSLHEDDADMVYEVRIKNINRAYFGQDQESEPEFRRHFARHLENHLHGIGTSPLILIGRWRYTFTDEEAVIFLSYLS